MQSTWDSCRIYYNIFHNLELQHRSLRPCHINVTSETAQLASMCQLHTCTIRYTATAAIALLLPYADTSHNRQNTGNNSLLQNCSQQALEYSRLQGRSQHAAFCTTHTASSSHQSGESQATEHLLRAMFEQQAVQATHNTDNCVNSKGYCSVLRLLPVAC